MKALRKEPERRYTSADELAADLRRFEDGQPVIARRDTWRYRSSKFVRRHAMVVAASAALVALLAGVATAMTLQAHRLDQQRAIAEREKHRSDETAKFLAGPVRELPIRPKHRARKSRRAKSWVAARCASSRS